MKKKSLLLSFVCVACCCIAQTISIPYDATSISDKYRNSNPDYVMYPASLDGKDSIEMTCDLNISISAPFDDCRCQGAAFSAS